MTTNDNNPVALNAIQPDTIVHVEGIGSMRYDSAVQAGFVNPAQVAQVAGPASGPAQAPVTPTPHEASLVAPPEATEATQTGNEEALADAGAEQAITEFAQATDAGAQEALISAASSGDLNDTVLEQAANVVGAERVQATRAALEGQAREAIEQAAGLQGADADALIAEMYEQHGEAMASAIRTHLTERNTEGYRALAAQMLVGNLDLSEGLPQAGDGVTIRQDQGEIIIGAHGQEYSLATALRLGVVKISNV